MNREAYIPEEGLSGYQTFVTEKSKDGLPTDISREWESVLPPGAATPNSVTPQDVAPGNDRVLASPSYNTPGMGQPGPAEHPRTIGVPGEQEGSPTKFDYGVPTRRTMTSTELEAYTQRRPWRRQKKQRTWDRLDSKREYRQNKSRIKSRAKRWYKKVRKNQQFQTRREKRRENPRKYERKRVAMISRVADRYMKMAGDIILYDQRSPDSSWEKPELSKRPYKQNGPGQVTSDPGEMTHTPTPGGIVRPEENGVNAPASSGKVIPDSMKYASTWREETEDEGRYFIRETPHGNYVFSYFSTWEGEEKSTGGLIWTGGDFGEENVGEGFDLDEAKRRADAHYKTFLADKAKEVVQEKKERTLREQLLDFADDFRSGTGDYKSRYELLIRQALDLGMIDDKLRRKLNKHNKQVSSLKGGGLPANEIMAQGLEMIVRESTHESLRVAGDHEVERLGDLRAYWEYNSSAERFYGVVSGDDVVVGGIQWQKRSDTWVVSFLPEGEDGPKVRVETFTASDPRAGVVRALQTLRSKKNVYSRLVVAAKVNLEQMKWDFIGLYTERDALVNVKWSGDLTKGDMEEVAWELGYEGEDYNRQLKPFKPLAKSLGANLRKAYDAGVEANDEGKTARLHKTAATIADIERNMSPDVMKRAESVKVSLARADQKNGIWTFKAQGSKDESYTVRVKAIPKGDSKEVGKLQVKVSCTCDFFRYQGPEHWAKVNDYLYGKTRGTASTPTEKDPEGKHWACKHVWASLGKAMKYRVASQVVAWDDVEPWYADMVGRVAARR